MKISEAFQIYRGYRRELTDQTRSLVQQRNAAQEKAKITGSQEDAQLAATLELSIKDTQEKFDANQEILDSLTEQWCAVANAESTRQQSDAAADYAVELSKIMEVARRISTGGIVPWSDEKKLMEFSNELYQAAKSAAALHDMQEKREKYKSLWEEEEEEKEEQPDPLEVADNAEAAIDLPDIPISSEDTTSSQMAES